jgi:phosphate:Na+ symporter
LVGCIVTFIVQSSSATLGITIGLAQIGVIPYETAAALVLGENIGTTITAWLASFGATTNAKRAAYFHVLFNVAGVMWITAVFPWYIMLIKYLTVGDPTSHMALEDVGAEAITAAIASTHTGFNVANTLVFLPLTGLCAKLLVRLLPDRGGKVAGHLTSLDVRMLESPTFAVEQSRLEVIRMADGCQQMMDWVKQLLTGEGDSDALIKKALELEDEHDSIQQEIVAFISNLLGANVPHKVIDEARRQLRITDEYESVSDSLATIVKTYRRMRRDNLTFVDREHNEILDLHNMVSSFMQLVHEGLKDDSVDLLSQELDQGHVISKRAKLLLRQIVERMPDERLSPSVSVAYNRQVGAYRHVRDHLVNVAEAVAGQK